MPKTLRGHEVALKVGQITQVDGVWFRVHKIAKRDVVFRRLNAQHVAVAERVKAMHEMAMQQDAGWTTTASVAELHPIERRWWRRLAQRVWRFIAQAWGGGIRGSKPHGVR